MTLKGASPPDKSREQLSRVGIGPQEHLTCLRGVWSEWPELGCVELAGETGRFQIVSEVFPVAACSRSLSACSKAPLCSTPGRPCRPCIPLSRRLQWSAILYNYYMQALQTRLAAAELVQLSTAWSPLQMFRCFPDLPYDLQFSLLKSLRALTTQTPVGTQPSST